MDKLETGNISDLMRKDGMRPTEIEPESVKRKRTVAVIIATAFTARLWEIRQFIMIIVSEISIVAVENLLLWKFNV